MKANTDLSKVLKKEHEEKWVALSKDQRKVIDYSEKLLDLTKRIGQNNDKVVYMKVLRSDTTYAFQMAAWKSYPYTGQWDPLLDAVYRPLLQVTFRNGDSSFQPLALIDSGAEPTVLNSEIASVLGINLHPCQKIKIGGVGSSIGRRCEVTLEIPELKIKKVITAIFVDDLPFSALLGQRDFFSEVDVKFSKKNELFFLKRA